MTLEPSTAVATFQPSEAVLRVQRTSLRVQQPQSKGDLVSLAMGEPDFDTPQQVRAAAARALEEGYTHYSPLLGELVLREELAARIGRLLGEVAGPGDVLITQGGTAGLSAAILGIVNPGDKVVIPDPTYSLYADLVSMAGGMVVPVPLTEDLHWDLEALATALEGAKMFVFCNPSNPTGIVHSRAELEALAGMLADTDTLVLSDEAYSDLVYTEEPFTSALEIPGLAGRTIYCQTFSKSYAMTGWRVGYLWGPSEVIASAARVHNTFNGSMNTAVQMAALTALKTCGPDIKRMHASYAERRQLMVEGLSKIPGLTVSSPEGAFYLFPKYDVDMPAARMVTHLREFGVAVRPGSEFGRNGEHHLRLSYAASAEAISIGVQRLAAGLAALRPVG
ncbi:pyridoxal phosphate-dependent aminotransferase [Paenarthrobacter ureafaciens]|jgi:aspartate aminotransferase|uniref:pyridoxal phosphate-dependent aminotransferase n=1 Tax=Paenarthrobacter TaxID=1742992 RepID=UPI00222EC917|nr:aminotransferase class I/II-fold pyridoxal phosphate-dependent enzyme [Paenarthrobacter sp. PAE-2]MCW3765340.1 aminotransferase class I/II-fold pyridoxal phosphate-dependent enzyme [Paenarthrobacter sp. PAE-2]